MDKHALIVGCSDGIGLGVARVLLRDGCLVTGVSRSPSALAHERYEHAVFDVTAPDYATSLSALVGRRGPVDVCVYCAGIGELFADAGLAADPRVLQVNLVGAAITAEVVIPPMLQAGAGHFVGLSSLADAFASRDAPSYAASKAGLSSYLVGLALALRGRGVYVTNVRFGFVDTKMARSPVRPFMISVERAADVVKTALRRRPIQLTYPKRMALLVWLVARAQAVSVWRS